MILINLPQQYNENRFHFETLNTNTKPSHIDSIDTNTREYLLFYYLCSFCIIDDIILTSLCLRLYGSLGNDPVVGSLVMWVVWKHEVSPDSRLERIAFTTQIYIIIQQHKTTEHGVLQIENQCLYRQYTCKYCGYDTYDANMQANTHTHTHTHTVL